MIQVIAYTLMALSFVSFMLTLTLFELLSVRFRRWQTISYFINRWARVSTARRLILLVSFVMFGAGSALLGVHLAFGDVVPGL